MTDPDRAQPPATDAGPSPALPDRGLRLLRLSLAGIAKDYEVDLRAEDGSHQPLSVIAGPTNTGKTSVLRFFNYCLGGSDYPDNAEVIRQVRSAVTEAAGPDGWFALERGINAANVIAARRPVGASDDDPAVIESRPVEPTGDPASVSQLLLTTVGLQHVQLKEAPTKASSGTDPLSFRDLMWLCLFLNERIGSSQLLHEHDTWRRLKFQQVVDAVFGVHDDDSADLARRLKEAREQRDQAKRDTIRLAEFVREQQAQPLAELERDLEQADADIRAAAAALAELEARQSAATGFAADLRRRHTDAAAAAGRARARVRDRRSLVNRFASLRAQYADDVRKLTLLTEAAEVFDQLSVTVCPACLSELDGPPSVVGGRCSLCAHELPGTSDDDALSLAAVGSGTAADPGDDADRRAGDVSDMVKFELRSTKRRYAELNEFWQQLEGELAGLERTAVAADGAEAEAAAAVDRASAGLLTPYATEREETLRRRQAALVLRDRADRGVRLWRGVREREEAVEALDRAVERLRAEMRDRPERPDRGAVIGAISGRYAAILREIGYPKIDQPDETGPFIDDHLVPYARGRSYKEASSGGQVLISLAWIMAVFETAYEMNAAHPGFVIIDTPQKNLGGHAAEGDTEFSDSALVDRFYRHVITWLGGRGTGAQVIVVDNTPPALAEPYVVVRYTRDPEHPPFGLIDNEIG
jgi:hypothetical protein